MLDASIPLSIKTIDVQPGIQNYRDAKKQKSDLALADVATQQRAEELKSAQLLNTEEARKAHEDQTMRGLAQVNDVRTPEGQDQYLKDLQNLGLGHRVQDVSSQFQAQRVAQQKAQEDAMHAKRQEYIDRLDLRSRVLPSATDQGSYDAALTRLKSMGDDLSGLEPNYSPDSVKEHLNEVLSRKDSLEEQHKQFEEQNKNRVFRANDAFQSALPDLQKKAAGLGSDAMKRNGLVSEIYAKYGESPVAQKFIDDIKNNSTQFTINANQSAPGDEDFYAQQLAAGKMTPAQVDKMFSTRGGNKSGIMAKILAKAQQTNPDFNPAQASVDIKQAQDVTNNRTIALIDAALPNFDRLKKLSDKVERLPVKFVTRAALEGSRQFSNEDLALFDTMKILQQDEINQIFAGGKGGSDKSRQMAGDLLNETLPPKSFGKAIDLIHETMLTKKNAIKSTMGQYGKGRGAKDEAPAPAGVLGVGETADHGDGVTVKRIK